MRSRMNWGDWYLGFIWGLVVLALLVAGCHGPSAATVHPAEIADAEQACAPNGGLESLKVYADFGGNTYKKFVRCSNGALFESPK